MRRIILSVALVVQCNLFMGLQESSAQLVNRLRERNAKASVGRELPPPAGARPANSIPANKPSAGSESAKTSDANKLTELIRRSSTAETQQQTPEPAKETSSPPASTDANAVASMPLVSVETAGPAEINLGRRALFHVVVRNHGDSPAMGLIVRATLPRGADLVQAEPRGELTAQTVEFRLGELSPKAERKLQLELIPRRAGAMDLRTYATISTAATSSLVVRRPAVSVQVTGPTEAIYGDTIKFKAIITNTGDGLVEDVSIAQSVPEPASEGIALTQLVLEQIPTRVQKLMPGESQEIELCTQASRTGLIRADILVTAADGLESRAAAEVCVRRPEISVKTIGPEARQINRAAGYVILVSNTGDAPAENTVVTAKLPAGLEIVGIEKRTTMDRDSNSLTWKLAKLEPGATDTLKFQAKAIQAGEHKIAVSAVAERNLSADSAHHVVVAGKTDVAMSVDDEPGPIQVGGRVEYVIRLKNTGSKPVAALTVCCELSGGLAVEDSADLYRAGRTLAFPLIDELAVGEEKVLRLAAVGQQAGDHTIHVTLRCDALASELSAETSTLFFKTEM